MIGDIESKASIVGDVVSKITITGDVVGKTILSDSLIGNINIVHDVEPDDLATIPEVKTYLGIS